MKIIYVIGVLLVSVILSACIEIPEDITEEELPEYLADVYLSDSENEKLRQQAREEVENLNIPEEEKEAAFDRLYERLIESALANKYLIKYYKLEEGEKREVKDVPSCGVEYNNAYEESLDNKDLSFCWDTDINPNTVIFDNGIIREDVCKNSEGVVITIDDETCIESFAIFHEQPQLCTIFENFLFDAMAEKDQNIVYDYLPNKEIPVLEGFSINCVIEYNRIRDTFEGCHYLDNEIEFTKNRLGMNWGYSDQELCIQSYFTEKSPTRSDDLYGCDKYEFQSPTIKFECNGHKYDDSTEKGRFVNQRLDEINAEVERRALTGEEEDNFRDQELNELKKEIEQKFPSETIISETIDNSGGFEIRIDS